MNYATLLAHRQEMPLGGHVDFFEWQGSHALPVIIDRRLVWDLTGQDNLPKGLVIGGIPLRRVSYGAPECFIKNCATYARVDGVNYLSWLFYAAWQRASSVTSVFYYRVIVTLHVWNLADFNPAVRPSWRDIRWRGWRERRAEGKK